ncbi:porin family protein [Ferrimonas sediminicola]|nr:porin family protein [Ferrimonas sediminicola]
MKRTKPLTKHLTLCALLSGVAFTAQSEVAPDLKHTVSYGLGLSDFDLKGVSSDTGFVHNITYEYRLFDNLSVGVEYVKALSMELNTLASLGMDDFEVSYDSAFAKVKPIYVLSDHHQLYLDLGYGRFKADVTSGGFSGNKSGSALVAAAGYRYLLGDFSLGVKYQWLDLDGADAKNLMVDLGYRF